MDGPLEVVCTNTEIQAGFNLKIAKSANAPNRRTTVTDMMTAVSGSAKRSRKIGKASMAAAFQKTKVQRSRWWFLISYRQQQALRMAWKTLDEEICWTFPQLHLFGFHVLGF
jgi:hypothetical protein